MPVEPGKIVLRRLDELIPVLVLCRHGLLVLTSWRCLRELHTGSLWYQRRAVIDETSLARHVLRRSLWARTERRAALLRKLRARG
jgi:hypothetical protein